MKQKILLLLLLLGILSNAQAFDKLKLDSLITAIEKSDRGMGSLSIFEDGKEVYQKSYGYTDIAKNRKADKGTKYRIGSISKTFTATVILKLVESGKLTLDTPLSDFYPQIKNADKITMRHLLQHRSGIYNLTNLNFSQWNTVKHSKEDLLNRIIIGSVTFEPGERFEYSNSNYILLTWIAEDVTGKSYSELLQEMIIKPCGLKNTYIGSKIDPQNDEALSYVKLSEWKPESETDMSIPLGAGAITSTPTDLNLFFYHLFNKKLITAQSLETMKTMKDNFGFGLIQVPFYEKKGYGHTGGLDGFQANAWYFPDDKVSIAICSNAVVYPLNDIVIGALSIYFGKDYKLPEFPVAAALSPEQLTQYTGIYSGSGFPLKISITVQGNTLIGQATGQPAFPLEYAGSNRFRFEQAKLEMEFFPQSGKMTLTQFGGKYELEKE